MNCRQEVVDAVPCRRPHTDDFSSQFSVLSSQQNRTLRENRQLGADFLCCSYLLTENRQLGTENFFLVLFRHCPRNINDRQQHEHVSLENRNHDVQAEENDRYADRDHGKEYECDQVAGENVCPETHRQ
jgi:hypothetical protein